MTEPSSRLPDDTVREILALAEKATPGPWVYFYKSKYNEHHVSLPTEPGQMKIALFSDGCTSLRPEGDASYIASVDPTTISLALSELLASRKVVEAAEKMAGALDAAEGYLVNSLPVGEPDLTTLPRVRAALHAYRQAIGEEGVWPPVLPADVIELVCAAREVAFEDYSQDARERLDRASEAFADRVPWDDEPAPESLGETP